MPSSLSASANGRPTVVAQLSTIDLVSFGRAFIASPALVERLRGRLPIAPGDEATYYQRGDAGHLTYSAHQQSA